MQGARVELRRVGKSDRTQFDRDPFAWLVAQRGCWLVRLVQWRIVDHAVVVARGAAVGGDATGVRRAARDARRRPGGVGNAPADSEEGVAQTDPNCRIKSRDTAWLYRVHMSVG